MCMEFARDRQQNNCGLDLLAEIGRSVSESSSFSFW